MLHAVFRRMAVVAEMSFVSIGYIMTANVFIYFDIAMKKEKNHHNNL